MIMVFKSIAALVCHQIPARSLELGGDALPLCARCTGLYAGFALGIFYLIVTRWLGERRERPRSVTLLPVAMVTAFGVQAMGERLGFWESSNGIRLAFGLLAGHALNLMLTPLTFRFLGCQMKTSADRFGSYWGACLPLSSMFVLLRRYPFIVLGLASLSMIGLLLIYALLNIAVVAALLKFEDQPDLASRRIHLAGLVLAFFGGEWLGFSLIQ